MNWLTFIGFRFANGACQIEGSRKNRKIHIGSSAKLFQDIIKTFGATRFEKVSDFN